MEVTEAMPSANRLALVVLDGLGSKVWEHAKDQMPLLAKMATHHHKEIYSVLPSMTYICLSTMLTGVSPQAHGIADLETLVEAANDSRLNTLFDSIRGTGQKTLLAVHERDVAGVPVSRFADITILAKEPNDEEIYSRVPVEASRFQPCFMFIHLLEIDESGHQHGPYSQEVRQAATKMNHRLEDLIVRLSDWEYSILLVADHGMHQSTKESNEDGHQGVHDGSVEEDLAVPLIWASAEEVKHLLAT